MATKKAKKKTTKPRKKRVSKIKLPKALSTKVKDVLKEARDYVKENRQHFKTGL